MTSIKMFTAVFKLAVTGILMWLLFHKIDFEPTIFRLSHMHAGWACFAVVILFAQLILTSIRWYLVCDLLGARVRFILACRLTLVGQFFNQILPSSVGGDAVRIWQLSENGILLRRALSSVICDRITALIVLTLIVAITLPIIILTGSVEFPYVLPIAITISLATLAIFFIFLWGEAFHALLIKLPYLRSLGALLRDLRIVLVESYSSVKVIIISVVVQIMVACSIYFIGLALEVKLNLLHFVILPLILLLSSLPISFAGWGLRESIMIIGLNFGGISEHDALAISVSFGIAQIFVGLPGMAITILRSFKSERSSLKNP
jgi:uncharacterized protein (TIRG00374 family)